MEKRYFIIFYVVFFINFSKAFNIATDSIGMEIINISTSFDNRTTLAGYAFFASLENHGKLQIIAGAPKYDNQGTVFSCSTDNNLDSTETRCDVAYNKSSFQPGKQHRISEADAFGLTVVSTDERTSYLACAPGRLKYCGRSIQQMPGACYLNNNIDGEGDSYGNLNLINWEEIECFTTFLDLVFLVDSSSSISNTNFEQIKNVLINVSDVFRDSIGGSTQLGVVLYGDQFDNPNLDTPFTPEYYPVPTSLGGCKDISCFKMKIRNEMNHSDFHNTYTALAIRKVVENVFFTSSNAEKSNKVLVLITDGEANDPERLQDSYELTEEHNITVYAVGVGSEVKLDQLYTSANGNTGTERVLKLDNYDQLSVELNELARIISNVQSEGQSSNNATSTYENALMGFSAHYQPETGDIYVGAVGAFDGTGSVARVVNGSIRNLPQLSDIQTVLSGSTNDSYLGYAVTSGFYEGGNLLFVAAGAPRHQFYGAVLIYQPSIQSNFSNARVIKATYCPNCQSNNRQAGSYFGGSLLSTDINGDGRDDLLVGAPLYVSDNYDEGRVFVYLSQDSDSMGTWTSTNYRPTILNGGNSEGSRFGMAMSSVGDLNNDGYNDVIISAPTADYSKGLIFLYHGSKNGIVSDFAQKIPASDISSNLQYFGLSVQGNIDVDENGIPDILVSAPFSQAIVLLRSRPVVDFIGTLDFYPANINIIECFNRNELDCLILKTCLTASGKSIEESVTVKFNISVDPVLKRVQFEKSGNGTFNQVKNGYIQLQKNVQTCWNYTLFVKPNNLIDYDSNIDGNMFFNLYHQKDSDHLTSITNINAKTELVAASRFNRSCANEECLPDLILNGDIFLPNLTIARTKLINNVSTRIETDLSQNRTIFVVSSETIHQPLILKVNLTNRGENSFGTEVVILFSEELNYIKLSSVVSSNTLYPNCIRDEQNDAINGSLNTKNMKYQYSTSFGSIMPQNTWCYFEVEFSAVRLRNSGTKSKLYFAAIASSMASNNTEAKRKKWESEIRVIYRSDLEVNRKGFDSVTYFKFDDENLKAKSVYGIGENISSIVVDYEVRNLGLSNVPNIEIYLKYPSNLNSNTQRLLYLYDVQCNALEGGASCQCDSSVVNPLQLSTTANSPTGHVINIYANQHQLPDIVFDCSNANHSIYCDTLKCDIKNLGASDVIVFKSFFRLWSQALRFSPNQTSVRLRSEFTLSTFQSPLIYNKDGSNRTIITSTIDTTAQQYQPPVQLDPSTTLFIFVYSSIGGFLFLIAIVLVLYKVGFFSHSKYAVLRIEAAEDANRVEMENSVVVGGINIKRISTMEI